MSVAQVKIVYSINSMERVTPIVFKFSRKTVNTRENFWNVSCFATSKLRDEIAKGNRRTTAWISHVLTRNNELAFPSTTTFLSINVFKTCNSSVETFRPSSQNLTCSRSKHLIGSNKKRDGLSRQT